MTVNVLGRRLPAAATYAAALGAALFLLIVVIVGAFVQTERSANVNQSVRESFDRRAHYRLLLQSMQDAETGQRGYLLTNDASYLEPYRQARVMLGGELDSIGRSATGDPMLTAEARRIRELVDRKMGELEQTIQLQGRGRQNEAMLIVRSDRGRELMDELRGIIDAAQARENTAINEQTAESDRAGLRLRLVIVLAGLLIVGIGVLLIMTVRNAMAELRGSRDQAEAASAQMRVEMEARESAEAKVRQMQKMEAIGQLTGGVAHDFNNMLAVIISALQLAQRRLDRGEGDVARFLEAAMDGARRAATLTSRLLAFARRQPLQPAVVDVNRVLSGMSEMLQRTLGEGVQLETVLAGGLWRVNIDVAELENAILNICVNARDAMPGGGKLTIESGNAFLDEQYAADNADVTAGQYVMIAVTDTGQGMPADVRAKAFEPFFTTKEVGKGTGLGLSHVHGFLKQSGGHVAIYSEMGVGTTIKLYMPRTQAAADAPDDRTPLATEDLPQGDPGTIILVVEDEERVRLVSVATLRELGYTVLHASGGEKALQMLSENPGIKLMFTDVVMPGMTGRALADAALKRWPELKVIYTTGYTQNAIVHNGVVDEGAELILKPYTMHDLARKMRAVLDGR